MEEQEILAKLLPRPLKRLLRLTKNEKKLVVRLETRLKGDHTLRSNKFFPKATFIPALSQYKILA